jgi:hypothetical protein
MSYTIGFVPKNQREMISVTEAPTANQALAVIMALQESAEEINFIRSPQEGEMGIEMLLLLAKEEAEEVVTRSIAARPARACHWMRSAGRAIRRSGS